MQNQSIQTKILAHRGESASAPENTMASFIPSMEKGFEGIEFDVHLTKDGVPVIIHDETIDRTSDGKGYVKDMTLKELKAFHFGIKHDPTFQTKYEIPTLEEFFAEAYSKGYRQTINIELKNDVFSYPFLEKKVLDLARQYGVTDQLILSSFNHQSLRTVRELSKDVKVALLYHKDQVPKESDLKDVGAYSANIHYENLIEKSLLSSIYVHLFKTLASQNIKLFAYTVNRPEDASKLMLLESRARDGTLRKGIDGIYSDNPSILMQKRNELEMQKSNSKSIELL